MNAASRPVVCETNIPGWPVRRGKVRDVYDLGDRMLLCATDRLSAFDWILPTGIPDKGRVLVQLSAFWFERLGHEHHLLGLDLSGLPWPAGYDWQPLQGRSMLVRKCQIVPIECVVRGYLAGSGWQEYRASGTVCGLALPACLRECDRLPEPIFTPATKADAGHDENISFEEMAARIGSELAEDLRSRSLEVYRRGAAWAEERGILLADTKLEWGQLDGRIILCDEVLTPDSSRFWPARLYAPGRGQPSFDKQFVRDWLVSSGWDRESPPPALPSDIVAMTRAKYLEALEILTGQSLQDPG